MGMKKSPKVYSHAVNLRAIAAHNVEVKPNKIIYKYFDNDKNIAEMTFETFGDKVERMIGAMQKCGLCGKRIAIIGEACPEWHIAFYAIISAGSVAVPLDRELLHSEIAGFLKTAEADAIIMSPVYSEKFESLKEDGVFDGLSKIIRVDNGKEWNVDDDRLCTFDEFLENGNEYERPKRSDIMRRSARGDMSIMLFTSGTTGTSKCVMLSERNIVSCANSAVQSVDFNEDDILMSVLPLHHTYELAISIAENILGVTVCINDSLKHVVKNLKVFRPTGMALVPLFVSTFNKRIWDEVRKKGKERQLKIGIAASKAMLTVGVDIRQKLFSEVLSAFGGRLEKIICGGAAMDPTLTKTFDAFGITLCEGYGITECSPLIAVNPYYARKTGSVGPTVPCCTARIEATGIDEKGNEFGEIQVKGDNVMLGYYNNDKANADAFTEDGWFRTGDIGYMDKDGYIFITGRQKSVIVLNNGKNVFPEELEEYLEKIDKISESVVVGRTKEDAQEVVLTAVVYPNFDMYKKDEDINVIAEDIKKSISELNKKLPSFKQIRNIEIRKTEFEKTSSRKIKRFLVK